MRPSPVAGVALLVVLPVAAARPAGGDLESVLPTARDQLFASTPAEDSATVVSCDITADETLWSKDDLQMFRERVAFGTRLASELVDVKFPPPSAAHSLLGGAAIVDSKANCFGDCKDKMYTGNEADWGGGNCNNGCSLDKVCCLLDSTRDDPEACAGRGGRNHHQCVDRPPYKSIGLEGVLKHLWPEGETPHVFQPCGGVPGSFGNFPYRDCKWKRGVYWADVEIPGMTTENGGRLLQECVDFCTRLGDICRGCAEANPGYVWPINASAWTRNGPVAWEPCTCVTNRSGTHGLNIFGQPCEACDPSFAFYSTTILPRLPVRSKDPKSEPKPLINPHALLPANGALCGAFGCHKNLLEMFITTLKCTAEGLVGEDFVETTLTVFGLANKVLESSFAQGIVNATRDILTNVTRTVVGKLKELFPNVLESFAEINRVRKTIMDNKFLKALLEVPWCNAAFKGDDIQDTGLCADMPLNPNEQWSIVSVTIPNALVQATTLCPGYTGDMEFCVASSVTNSVGPTGTGTGPDPLPLLNVAMAINTGLYECILMNPGLAAATSGISSAIGAALGATSPQFGVGISLGQQFRRTASVWDGVAFRDEKAETTEITVKGNFFFQAKMSIPTDKLKLPDGLLELEGDALLTVNVFDPVILHDIAAANDPADIFRKAVNNFAAMWDFSATAKIGLSSISKGLLPDLDIELGVMTALAQAGQGNGMLLDNPGLYLWVEVTDFVKAAFQQIVLKLLESLNDFLAVVPGIDPTVIADGLKDMDTTNAYFGLALTVPQAAVAFKFPIELPSTGLPQIKFGHVIGSCTVTTSDHHTKCDVSYQPPDAAKLVEAVIDAVVTEVETVVDGVSVVVEEMAVTVGKQVGDAAATTFKATVQAVEEAGKMTKDIADSFAAAAPIPRAGSLITDIGTCPGGTVHVAGGLLCQKPCGRDYTNKLGVCWRECTTPFKDGLLGLPALPEVATECLYASKPKRYNGVWPFGGWKSCSDGYFTKWYGGIPYCDYRSGCPTGMARVNTIGHLNDYCMKDYYTPELYTLQCPDDKPDHQAGLCYKRCDEGYTGVGPLCVKNL